MDIDDGGDRDRRAAILQEMLHQVVAIRAFRPRGITDMLPLVEIGVGGF